MIPIERVVSPGAEGTADHAILLSIGLGVLAESAVVLLRAMRTDGEIVWASGRDGAPHTVNPAFEKVREFVNVDLGGPVAADAKRFGLPKHDW